MMKNDNADKGVSRVDPIAKSTRRGSRRISDAIATMASEHSLAVEQVAGATPKARLDGRSMKRRAPTQQMNVRIDERTFGRLRAYCMRTDRQIGATVEDAVLRLLDAADRTP